MQLVVDANILFSALLKDSITRRLILDRRLRLYSPKFILKEYEKYARLLKERSGLPQERFKGLSILILSRISLIDDIELAPFTIAAKHLTMDPKDETYVAAALAVNANIWSKDKHLRTGRIRCWSTEELAEYLYGKI